MWLLTRSNIQSVAASVSPRISKIRARSDGGTAFGSQTGPTRKPLLNLTRELPHLAKKVEMSYREVK